MGRKTCALLSLFAFACGSGAAEPTAQDEPAAQPEGGAATGGRSGTGGSTGAGGGSSATGGSTGAGGSKATGGSTGAGGSKATGGSTGAGGSADSGPPHVLGDCPSAAQGGPGAAGVFQQIAPPGVSLTPSGAPWSPGGIASAAVDLVSPTTVYAGADTQGIFRSTDCGTTWTKVDTGRNSAALDSGTPWTLLVDPSDSNVLYATSMYGNNSPGLYKSTNAGVDWDVVYPNADTQAIADWVSGVSIDPTNTRHLLLAMHMNCNGAYAPACIGESTNAGATWRMIKVPTGGWSHNANMFPLTATTWMYGAGADGLFLTEDSGATWQKVAPNAMNQEYQAADGSYYVSSLEGVRRSTDLHTWTTLPNSRSIAVIGDGKHVYASDDAAFKTSAPIHRAPETDPMTWTALTSPAGLYGANMFSYDPDHHILYMPATSGGLWRMVTY